MTNKRKFALIVIVSGSIGLLILFLNTYFNPDPENTASPFIQSVSLLKYFTVQSNIVVLTYFLMLFSFGEKNERFIKMIGGVTVYITITFIVFAVMLQATYHPEGWGIVSNLFNHYITPILVISFLVIHRNEYNFEWKDTLYWIIYPLIYLVWVVIHGAITGDYLYPFFQIGEIGIFMFIVMVLGLIAFFYLLSFVFMKIVTLKNGEK